MKKNHNSQKNKGFALVEVMVACAIITVATFALVSTGQKGVSLSERALRQTQASYILEEGAEAVKSIRDQNWTDISSTISGSIYYMSYDTFTNSWVLSLVPNVMDDIFTRTVVFDDVYRDVNEDIASSGTLDARTKKITVTVSWPSSSGVVSKSLVFYIADIFN